MSENDLKKWVPTLKIYLISVHITPIVPTIEQKSVIRCTGRLEPNNRLQSEIPANFHVGRDFQIHKNHGSAVYNSLRIFHLTPLWIKHNNSTVILESGSKFLYSNRLIYIHFFMILKHFTYAKLWYNN